MKQFTADQITNELRQMCAKSSQADVARRFGMLRSNLNHILAGRKPLGSTLAKAMGYKKLPDKYVREE